MHVRLVEVVATKRDCRRLPGIIQDLWDDLPYSIPFLFDISNEIVFGVERKNW